MRGACRRCYIEKNEVKKFSARNNMDPDDIPEELRRLTQIEEMLITQIFLIVSVYCLCGSQYAYHDHVINFSQDVQEFAICLSHRPSTLDVLVVCCHSSDGRAFKDFNIH